MSAEIKKRDTKLLHMCVVLAIMIIFQFLPPVGEMTKAGMQVFGIFVGSLYGWIFVDLLLPSIVALVLVGTTDAITMTQFFINGIGSQTVVLVMGILFLTVYISQTNLSNVIVSWIMSRKIALGRPYVCLLLFLLACYLVSTISNALVTLVLFLPLYRSLAEKAGIAPFEKMNVVYFAGLGIASCMGEISAPFKPFILIVTGMMTNFNISIGALTAFLFPVTLGIIILYVLFCKFVLRIKASQYAIMDLSEFQVRATKKQIVGLIFIGILLLCLLLPSFMPADFILNRLGNGGTVLGLIAIMLLIRIDGEPLMDIRTVGKDFNWDIFFNVIYFAPMGTLLTSEVTGIQPTLSNIFGPVLSNLSPYVLVIAVVAIVTLLTNFLNNAVVAMLFVSVVIVLGESMAGVNPIVIAMLIILASFFSLVTPAANAAIAFLFTQTDLIKAKDFMGHAIVTCIFLVAVTVTLGYGYANIIF